MRTRDRALLVAVGATALFLLLVIALAAQPERHEESGARAGSTRLAGPDGTEALFQYLQRVGLQPSRADEAELAVPGGGALVVIAANLSQPEAEALVERVRAGTSVLIASDDPTDPVWRAFDLAVNGEGVAGRDVAAFPAAAVKGVSRVEVDGSLRGDLGAGSLAGAGWVELLADDQGSIALEKRLGAGDVLLLLDPSVLSNGGLPKAQNLRFADAALRHLAPSGEIVFDEFHHGWGEERSVTGWFRRAGLLPAIWLLLVGLALELLRRNRGRLGPARPGPVPERRAVREFVRSYAGLLSAAGHRAWAVRALERTLRRRLEEDLGIPHRTPPQEVFRRLTSRAPNAAARAYRALERAADLAADPDGIRDRDILDLARDVRAAEAALRPSGAPLASPRG